MRGVRAPRLRRRPARILRADAVLGVIERVHHDAMLPLGAARVHQPWPKAWPKLVSLSSRRNVAGQTVGSWAGGKLTA